MLLHLALSVLFLSRLAVGLFPYARTARWCDDGSPSRTFTSVPALLRAILIDRASKKLVASSHRLYRCLPFPSRYSHHHTYHTKNPPPPPLPSPSLSRPCNKSHATKTKKKERTKREQEGRRDRRRQKKAAVNGEKNHGERKKKEKKNSAAVRCTVAAQWIHGSLHYAPTLKSAVRAIPRQSPL